MGLFLNAEIYPILSIHTYNMLTGQIDKSLIKDECLFEIFESSVDLYPDNPAVIFDGKIRTYREIDSYANKLARYLILKGVGKGDFVGILLKKSVETTVALLGIIKAGAAYVPLEISYPHERVKYIIDNCGIKLTITSSDLSHQFDVLNSTVLIDSEYNNIQEESSARLKRNEIGVTPGDLCYVIYTSGTTGNPKGVAIEHKNVCHLVRASQTIYRIEPKDIVYQGFTTAFDASVEEIWMAFGHGAALVPATSAMQQAGPNLFNLLADLKVTVISCVPTLLSLMEDHIPSLRLLILGGEECQQQLAEKWCVNGRRLINTYGPTEATVIATYCEYIPGKNITIGRPIPNYSIYIIHENGSLAETVEEGELLIGGIGVARGYIGLDQVTKEKFIVNPWRKNADDPERLYRSGDLAMINKEGEVEFRGRIDDQVKIRGFRIELTEIESVFSSFKGVKKAVTTVVHLPEDIKALAVYLLPENKNEKLDIEKIYRLAKERLPSYMLPRYVEIIDEIPLLPSGKVNKKKLPEAKTTVKTTKDAVAPQNEFENKIYQTWKKILDIEDLSIHDHFFNDLGGHSLLAAQVVSALRFDPEFESLKFSDLYEAPTIELLAKKLESQKNRSFKEEGEKRKQNFLKSSFFKHKLCGFGQLISLYFAYLLLSVPVVTVFYIFFSETLDIETFEDIIRVTFFLILGYFPFMMSFSVLVKWLIIGRYKAGKYPVWGSYYFRWWVVRLFQSLFPGFLLNGTPLMSIYLRLMGAKVGKDCYIGSQHIKIFDLLKIGDEVNIGLDSQLLGYTVENGYLILGQIEIGNRSYIGTHSILNINTKMEEGAMLLEQSMLPSGSVIPSCQSWSGSPAGKCKPDQDVIMLLNNPYRSTLKRRILYGFAYFFSLYIFEFIPMIAISPISFMLYLLYWDYNIWSLVFAPVAAILFILILCLEIIILKKFLLGKIKPGIYSIYSGFYLRKWIIDQLMYMSLSVLHTLYATLYTLPFLRLMGATIGKRVEVSTVTHISPDLLFIDDESFFADASMAGTPKVYMEKTQVAESIVGKRTFIGNSALLPANKTIGDNCLIGVLSIPPQTRVTESGTSWLGSPSIFLHKRDINKSFSETETYSPTKKLYIKRLLIEFVRIILPSSIAFMLFTFMLILLGHLDIYLYFKETVLIFPFIIAATQIASALITVFIKWVVMGRYKPRIKPLWSTFVWKTELVTGIYESVAVPFFLNYLQGTPFFPWFLRLFGCKIGKRVFIDTTFFSEFDLVCVGDNASINFHATMQTHLFEDRVMKMSYMNIGEKCSVGSGSVVLYDTRMEEGSKLGSLSLLMKGETLPAWSSWQGNPARRSEE